MQLSKWVFIDLTESQGWSQQQVETKTLQVRQRVYMLVKSFELPAYPFIVKMQGSRVNMYTPSKVGVLERRIFSHTPEEAISAGLAKACYIR